jgi:prophage regulatory protein
MSQAVAHHTDRILRKPAVIAMVGLSYTTLWRQYRAGRFPAPVRLSPGAVGWRESDITAWLASRQSTVRAAG